MSHRANISAGDRAPGLVLKDQDGKLEPIDFLEGS